MSATLRFPSEAEAIRKQVEAERSLTPTQRLLAVVDLLRTVEALSAAGNCREAQLRLHEDQEEEWRRIMKEFFARYAHA